MYAGLTPEVWTLVLRHVKKPVPPVNSGPEARINQHDLASCMRVSEVGRPHLLMASFQKKAKGEADG